MIRTFAVLATDLLDEEKRRAWDETMCAYESMLEQVQARLSSGRSKVCDGLKIAQSTQAAGAVVVTTFSVAKATASRLQGHPPSISRLDVAEFEEAAKACAEAMNGPAEPEAEAPPSGPRILSRS